MEEVRWQLAAFIELVVPGATRYVLHPAADADTRACHAWLKGGLDQLRRGRPWRFRVERPSTYGLSLEPRRLVPVTPLTGGFAPFTEAFVSESAGVLEKRLAFCPAAECGKPYIIYRRRKYCSQSCADRERIRRFRAKNPDYARDQYRRKQRRTVYPGVKIQPRTRPDRGS